MSWACKDKLWHHISGYPGWRPWEISRLPTKAKKCILEFQIVNGSMFDNIRGLWRWTIWDTADMMLVFHFDICFCMLHETMLHGAVMLEPSTHVQATFHTCSFYLKCQFRKYLLFSMWSQIDPMSPAARFTFLTLYWTQSWSFPNQKFCLLQHPEFHRAGAITVGSGRNVLQRSKNPTRATQQQTNRRTRAFQ